MKDESWIRSKLQDEIDIMMETCEAVKVMLRSDKVGHNKAGVRYCPLYKG
jgi:hypothetical protein